jgi:hypothetical protein
VRLRVLGGPDAGTVTLVRRRGRPVTRSAGRARERALELSLGALSLDAGRRVLRLRGTRPVTLDQVRLLPGRHRSGRGRHRSGPGRRG